MGKRIPPGGGDLSQDRPGGPLYQSKPVIKNSLRKSSRNYARALLILTLLGCISGHHVDALPIEKHDALIKCDLPNFNLKQRWNGSYGKEYEFLISQAKRLKERNEKKQNWIDIDSCDSTPEFDECDLKDQKVAKSVQRWMGDFFRRYYKAKRTRKGVYKEMKFFDQLLMKSSRLDHEVKDKLERCKEELYEVRSISSKNF